MAYTIRNTDGTTLLLLGDGKLDTNSTSITLVGKNYSSYGEIWNNNLVQLMGNFAREISPTSPIKGQLWYDTLNQKLNVYDGGWEPLNGAQISNTEPGFLNTGDLWFDSTNNQLFVKLDSGVSLIGPAFSSTVGSNGWVLPPVTVQDNASGSSGNAKQVTLLRNYGQTRGYVANERFTIATTSTYSYLTNNTTSTVKGLTLFGDVRATEQVYANTLTVTSNVVYPASQRVSAVKELDFWLSINNLAFRVFNTGPSFRPEIKTVSGTATISYAGFTQKATGVTGNAGSVSRGSTNLTTSEIAIFTDTGLEFNSVGDMLEIILSDFTTPTEAGIKTYRVVIQVAAITPTVRVSIFAEKIV